MPLLTEVAGSSRLEGPLPRQSCTSADSQSLSLQGPFGAASAPGLAQLVHPAGGWSTLTPQLCCRQPSSWWNSIGAESCGVHAKPMGRLRAGRTAATWQLVIPTKSGVEGQGAAHVISITSCAVRCEANRIVTRCSDNLNLTCDGLLSLPAWWLCARR